MLVPAEMELVGHSLLPAQLRQPPWPRLPLSVGVRVSASGSALLIAHHQPSRQVLEPFHWAEQEWRVARREKRPALEVVHEPRAGELLEAEQAQEVGLWAWISFSEQGFALRF